MFKLCATSCKPWQSLGNGYEIISRVKYLPKSHCIALKTLDTEHPSDFSGVDGSRQRRADTHASVPICVLQRHLVHVFYDRWHIAGG